MGGYQSSANAPLIEAAPAKVNLSLVVRGRRGDGYHELESLVAFALDVADTITLYPGATGQVAVCGPDLTPEHAALLRSGNIVDRAVASVASALPEARLGGFAIIKRIPLAAGLGGGSADAAAALRALARLNGLADPATRFHDLAVRLGADVPVCVGDPSPRAAIMAGIGDRLWRPPAGAELLPQGLACVLVNPRHEVPTGPVFRELAAHPLVIGGHDRTADLAQPNYDDVASLISALHDAPNDLEAPARRLAPVIGDVLAAIAVVPECLLSRMSGSGATCFGLFDGLARAERAAGIIASRFPGWWVRPSRLA